MPITPVMIKNHLVVAEQQQEEEPHRMTTRLVLPVVTPTAGEATKSAPLVERFLATRQRTDTNSGITCTATTTSKAHLLPTTDGVVCSSSNKTKDMMSSALELICGDEGRRVISDGDDCLPPQHPPPPAAAAAAAVENDDDDISVHSIERIMCPRAASFGSANKRMGGRWDTNLMEDSMPGLVSFCHGSFASEGPFNGSSVFGVDDDSVSSLECSVMNSQHSTTKQQQQPPPPPPPPPPQQQQQCTLVHESRMSNRHHADAGPAPHPHGELRDHSCLNSNNVLQPLARVLEQDGKHQEVRWSSGGELHRSSDTMPRLSRRQSRG